MTSPLKGETKQNRVNNLWEILPVLPFDRCLGIPHCMHSGLCNQHLGGKQPQLSCQQIRFSHKSYVLWFYYGTRKFHSKIWVAYIVWSSYSDPTSHVGTKLFWRKLQSSGLMVDINTFKPRKTWNFTIFNTLRPGPNGQHFKWYFRMHLCWEMNSSIIKMGLGNEWKLYTHKSLPKPMIIQFNGTCMWITGPQCVEIVSDL